MKVKYAGVANNAVRGAFQIAGFKKTSRPQWNVLWSKALKPEAYSALTKFQRVRLGCAVLGWAGLGWAGLGWAGLGWAGLGWAGLGWAGLGCAVLCCAVLCWAVLCCACSTAMLGA